VIAKRLKQSGMFWTVRGANAINRPTMMPPQSGFRRLLELPCFRCLINIYVPHPQSASAAGAIMGLCVAPVYCQANCARG
jgi:hypothetical protein